MSDECIRRVDVSSKGTGYSYVVRVLESNDSELIGSSVQNNTRIRVEKDKNIVYFLEDFDMDSLDDLRTANLISICGLSENRGSGD